MKIYASVRSGAYRQ